MYSKPANYKQFFYLAPAFALWIFISLPFINFYLLHVDTSVYILCAKGVLNGAVPYLDFWDHKPPLVYFLFALILKMCGPHNYRAINYLTLCFSLTSTTILFLIARKLTRKDMRAGIIAMFFPVLTFMFTSRDAVNPNTEIYMETFSLAAVYIALTAVSRRKSSMMFCSGVCIAMASGFKQPAAVMLPVICATHLIYYARRKEWKYILIGNLNCISGFVAVWVFIALYFYLHGGLSQFWFQCFQFNFMYSSAMPKDQVMRSLIHIYTDFMKSNTVFFVPYLIGIIWVVYSLIWREILFRYWFFLLFLLIWHIADTIGVSAGGIFFSHYFIQWIPSILLITFIPLFDLLDNLTVSRKWLFWLIVTIYCIGGVYVFVAPQYSGSRWQYRSPFYYYTYKNKWISGMGDTFYRYPYHYAPKRYWQIKRLVTAIRSETEPSQPFFVWGFMPELYLLASREPASRFLYTSFVTGDFYGLGNLYDTPGIPFKRCEEDIQSQLITDLNIARPPVIVTVASIDSNHARFFAHYLNKYYKPFASGFGEITLYRRKP